MQVYFIIFMPFTESARAAHAPHLNKIAVYNHLLYFRYYTTYFMWILMGEFTYRQTGWTRKGQLLCYIDALHAASYNLTCFFLMIFFVGEI